MKILKLALGWISLGSLLTVTAMAQAPALPPPPPADAAPSGGQAEANGGGDEKWTLPQPACLQQHNLTVGGWMEQGITFNTVWTHDRFNGIMGFNDRDADWQGNQVYFFAKRNADTKGCGTDWGGRVDVAYGSDGRFLQALDGLEANWHQVSEYQMALPQFYADLGWDDWTFRMGHFYALHGYEVCTAPDNFFYSHSLTFLFAEPFTHFGMLGIYKFDEQWSITNGFTRGNDKFDDVIDGKNALGYLGAVNWSSADQRLEAAFTLTSSAEGVGNVTNIYSLVGKYKLCDHVQYIVQHDCGQSTNPGTTARWYGLNQYLLHEINACWSAGIRGEWFFDNSSETNGRPVTGLRPGNALFGVPIQGDFYEVSLGLNWRPSANWTFRPEVRWDWADAHGAQGQKAFDAGTSSEQFLFGCDAIVSY